MADTTWKASTTAKATATLTSATEFRVIDDPAGTPASKKTTTGAIKTYINGDANAWSAVQTVSVAGAASTPALYLTGAVLTGGSGTTNFPHIFYQPSGATASTTWSTAGTAFGANMATGFTGSLFDFRIAGATRLSFATTYLQLSDGSGTTYLQRNSNGGLGLSATATTQTDYHFSGNVGIGFAFRLRSDGFLAWAPAAAADSGADTIIGRGGAAATLQFGGTDAASPTAQTTQVQSVIAGTSNTAGANWTHKGSRGTGTGAGGSLIFQTAPAGSTGSTQNALATGLTITAPAVNMQPSVVVGNQALATTATDGFLYIPTCAGAPSGVPTAQTGAVAMVFDTTNNKLYIYDGGWLGGTTPGAFV